MQYRLTSLQRAALYLDRSHKHAQFFIFIKTLKDFCFGIFFEESKYNEKTVQLIYRALPRILGEQGIKFSTEKKYTAEECLV